MSDKVTNNVVKMLILAVLLVVASSSATYFVTRSVALREGFKAGLEVGKGEALEAASGVTYELRLYGYKDGKVYEVEGPYGYSVNGQPVISRLPTDARPGDTAFCVKPGEEIKVIRKM